MQQTQPLTGTGKGIMLSRLEPGKHLPHDFIEGLIDKFSFVVIKGFSRPLEEVQEWIAGFGELVRNEKRVKETVLVLDGNKDDREVLGGKGRMPLHCDGLLMNENVRLVGIYGVEFDISQGGRTYISDNETAWDSIPDEIKNALEKNGIELLPCDTSYYLKNEPRWYHFPGVQTLGNRKYLNAGMYYHREERPSYLIKIAGLDEDISYAYYSLLEQIYEDDSMTYYHNWEPGDLLLMDNVRTMHGREAFTGKRSIAQFQVRKAK